MSLPNPIVKVVSQLDNLKDHVVLGSLWTLGQGCAQIQYKIMFRIGCVAYKALGKLVHESAGGTSRLNPRPKPKLMFV
jgi:hypothetical protein